MHADQTWTGEPAPHHRNLPVARTEWPSDASTAYSTLLNELNTWCAEHGWSPGNNAWVAEVALREAWD